MKRLFSTKMISLIIICLFLVVMLPIFYLSFYNRASGDDYGYGALTRMAWKESHSLFQVLGAAGKEVRDVYGSWQGTWLSVFLFALQPEVFSEHGYVVTVFLMSAFLLGGIVCLFHEIFCRRLHFPLWNRLIITVLFCLNTLLFTPSFKSALFWYNGTVHYTLPYAMCLVLAVLLLRYAEEYRLWQFIGIFLLMTLLGGSNYQAALFALIIAVSIGGWSFFRKREKKVFFLLLPVAAELAGLAISMKAPGNKVRGGEEFGFSLLRGIKAVAASFTGGIMDIKNYMLEKPLVFVLFLLMFLFIAEAWAGMEKQKGKKADSLFLAGIFCLYCAMQAPAAYAGVGVSGGVYNMNYWVFLLFFTAVLVTAAKAAAAALGKTHGRGCSSWSHRYLVIPGIGVCFLLCILFRGSIKDSLWYTCVSYIRSGQAEDYKEQMALQTRILMDDSVEDAVVPFINDAQGPLMQMPVTEDPDAWSNTVTSRFYGKNSVIAISRTEWEEQYGNEAENKNIN